MERMGGAGPRALFPKGPSFTLENFSSKDFIVRDFVESLAEDALPASRRSIPSPQSGSFEPKPLIRTFENALSQLGDLREQLEERESELQSQVRRAEAQHDQTLDTLGRKLDETMRQFEDLDLSLNNPNPSSNQSSNGGGYTYGAAYGVGRGGQAGELGGNLAVQIGEKLEELDRKRRRAIDATFLIQCWMEVSETGQLNSLEDMQRQGGTENRVRCAMIAQQLMRISQRLDPASWGQAAGANSYLRNGVTNGITAANRTHNTREMIEKFCEALEQDLLKQFNSSYRRQNFDDMRECAKVLHDFNGGSSVIAVFVNQHQFFIDRDQLIADEVAAEGDMWDQLADPDAEPPSIEPSLQSLVDEVKIVMQEESFIIKRAFPYYEVVLGKFIQRVFQQSIQQRLEMVLEKANSISSLAFLRSLHSARSYIGSLVEDLKTHGLTEHPEPCSAQISQVLDQQLEELFVPYLVGNSYIDREKRSLEELNSSLLFKYTIYHSRRKKAPTGFMASLAQQTTQLVSSAKDAYLERLDSSELTTTQKAMMMRLAGISQEQTGNNKNDIEVSDEDGMINVNNAKRMMRWLAESVRRTLELGAQTDTPKDVSVLLSLLLTSMGQVYIDTALDAALDAATSLESSRTEPDMSYLQALRPAVTITNIMSRFVSVVLIRLAEGNATVRRSMEAQTRTSLDGIEKKTNSVLKTTLDVVQNWVSKSLSANQKKTDFRPKDSDELFGQTSTCQGICTYLSRTNGLLAQSIDGHNREIVSCELARGLCKLLFEHFKKFNVNATGGLTVTQDIARYVATLKEYPVTKDVEEAVEMLPEIGSLFIIGSEALRERSRNLASGTAGPMQIRSGKRLYKGDFKAFVQKRDDASTPGIQGVLASLN
ncbi:putative exocyst complex component protein [Zalerion maritima]|uniref:Exocyst complex component protein n=1 Tax=Zalerion maritima TaxID=339359 RepID=A0AAD5RYR7_9PEZI|nr:putative exocyst complex component protein [Zalerion maritima]